MLGVVQRRQGNHLFDLGSCWAFVRLTSEFVVVAVREVLAPVVVKVSALVEVSPSRSCQ